MEQQDTYTRLISLLDSHKAHYRLIDHEPEGRTEVVSPMRGNILSQAAKCIVLMVKGRGRLQIPVLADFTDKTGSKRALREIFYAAACNGGDFSANFLATLILNCSTIICAKCLFCIQGTESPIISTDFSNFSKIKNTSQCAKKKRTHDSVLKE